MRGPKNATRAAVRVTSERRTGRNEWKMSRKSDGRAFAPRERSKVARAPVVTRGMSNPTRSGGKARRAPRRHGTRTHPRVARQAKPGGVRPAPHQRLRGRAKVAHPAHDARSTRAARGARRSARRFGEVRLGQKANFLAASESSSAFFPTTTSLVRDSAPRTGKQSQTARIPSKMRFSRTGSPPRG